MDVVKVKTIQVEMLKQRGYTIPDNELIINKKTKLNQTYSINNVDTLYVHYCLDDQLIDHLKKKK